MPALILEFASDKPRLVEIQDSILTLVKRHVNLDTNNPIPEPEKVGLFLGERQAAVFTYKWRLPLKKRIEESAIKALETQLSGLEVHKIYIEEST
jgi:hypothetical protein